MPLDFKSRHKECSIQYEEEVSGDATSKSLTFYPTKEQIDDFPKLIKQIEDETRAGSKCGVIKIIPPNGWKARKLGYTTKHIGDTLISKPVTESFSNATKLKCYTKDVSVYKNQLTWNELQNYAKRKKIILPKGKMEDRKAIDKLLWELMHKSTSLEQIPDPVYGADTEGTLYDDDVTTLNISHLGTILDDLKSTRMPGVTTTYMYFGMWRTMFPWHAEDVDLYSINYLHHGQPKHWWSVPPEAADLFERMMSQLFPDDASKCSAFLRHKNFIVQPELLALHGIPFSMTTQEKGQFIITFPRGYHMGYNTGLNVAESTNFASDRWVDFGMNYVMCKCKKDSVTIDVSAFVDKYREKEHAEKWRQYWHGSKSDVDRNKAIQAGKQYHLYVEDWMYSKQEPNLFSEREYNRMRSKHFPHCAVCEAFLPKECCEYKGEVPSRSPRFLSSGLFSKRDVESPFDSEDEIARKRKRKDEEQLKKSYGRPLTPEMAAFDPEEDDVLVCENCSVSVHKECYSKRAQYDSRLEGTPWRCARCCGNNEIRIRTATCALCELRGGALVQATLGSTPTFAHVLCVLAHRRSFFLDPAEYRNQVYIYPPPKYDDDDVLLRRLSDAAYRDVPRLWDSISNRYECQICKQHGEGLLVCASCVANNEDDPDIVHATCARAVGMRLERRIYPDLVVVYCHKHKRQMRLAEGTEVQVKEKMDDGVEKARRGIVVGYVEEEAENEEATTSVRCVVDFENYEISLNTEETDIVKCWCRNCDGKTHTMDSPVVVRWQDDGKEYPAYYRGPAPPAKYKIRFYGDDEREAQVKCVEMDEVEEYWDDTPPPMKKTKKSRKSIYSL